MADDDAPIPESEIEEGGEPEADSARLTEVHERALARFDSVAVPQQELRAQSLEARRFVTIPGAMWEGAWGEQFENSPRPEVDKITKSLEKIETDYKENRIVVDYVPANDSADEMTAETLDGMYRADSYHYKAMQARDNAFQEAIRGGMGAWRLTTDYADPCDPDNDEQRVNPGMTIVDADQCVYFGPSSLYDKSDSKWAFIVPAFARADAEAAWGAGNCTPFPADQWKYTWDWYTPDVVRIAEYYEVEEASDRLIVLTNSLTDEDQRFFASEIEPQAVADMIAKGWKKRERKVKRDRVHKYILNGTCVLKDCGYIAGDCIPIVPVYGRRDYVDNMERWRGHVGKKMDRQRIYNSAIANVVETNSLSPREIPIVAPEQRDETIDGQWSRINIDRLPYVQLHPLTDPSTGAIVSAGPVGKITPPSVQPGTAALIQISSADLTDDDDNADQVKANTSVDAMDLAAARVDAKSGIYLDNMRQSVQREGEIYQGMARDVYFEEGRTVETLSDDEQDGTATLMQPHVDDQGVFKIRNDLSRGRYKVLASVQEATATKRQRTVRESLNVGEIAGKLGDAELGQAALLTAMMNMDGEGMQDLQKFARQKALAIGLAKPTAEEKQQIEAAQAAQGQGQPSSAEQALLAQASEAMSKVKVNEATAVDKMASAHLKIAQADVVGGPEKAPEVPTGLHPAANDTVEAVAKLSAANLNDARAEHLRHGMREQTIKTGHEIEMDRRAADREDRVA